MTTVRSIAFLAAFVLVTLVAGKAQTSSNDAQPRDVVVKPDTLPPVDARWALVIGVDEYADPQVSSLAGAANDAAEFSGAIQRFAGFPKDQVIVLTTNQEPGRRPTRANILFHLSNLSALVPPNGLFLFFFAGHGVERDGEAFLLPSDARLTENLRILHATGISFQNVRAWIQEMPAKQLLVFLDACRNNPTAARGSEDNLLTESFTTPFRFSERNREIEAFAVLYATAVGSRAYENSSGGYGFFTGALVDGLKGGAADAAGEVTLGSLVRFVQDTVPKRVQIELGETRRQRPFAEIRGYRADELVLAKLSGLNRPPTPDGPLRSAAAEQLQAWADLRESNDPDAFLAFYKAYPDGPLAEQALQRKRELEWTRLEHSVDIVELKKFYEAQPRGAYSKEAIERIALLERTAGDRDAILALLREYADAYRARDAERVAAVWPSLDRKNLDRMRDFFQMAQTVEFELTPNGDPTVTGSTAVVACLRTLAFVDQRGGRRESETNLVVTLERTADGWALTSVAVQ